MNFSVTIPGKEANFTNFDAVIDSQNLNPERYP
jgi:hypothetical protein